MQTITSTQSGKDGIDHASELLALQANYDELIASSQAIEDELEQDLEIKGKTYILLCCLQFVI